MDLIEAVGADGVVVPVGGGTHWEPTGEGRRVRAPAGVVSYEPAEMTVRVRAGTTVAELDAVLAEHGQMVPLDPVDPARATVGGVLAEGVSGIRRLRWGPVRDTVLEVRYVSAEGRLVKSGGPVVKNVSGFDLCRLMVGSKGTLGVLAEVVLRVQPQPRARRWYRRPGLVDHRTLHRPSSVLWDGTATWVLLEGHPADIALDWEEVEGPPPLPPHRRSLRPAAVPGLTGSFVAEVGVGTVHVPEPPPPTAPDRRDLHARIKAVFDPAGRLNPERALA
ncbi:MAG TPA: FAD-binding protein [Acidimicrobiales bacterium]|nr:FAD-binding protein [Acidimicrobiales bacterium]